MKLPTLTGVTSDSRKVKPGFAFVAIAGAQTDGHAFIQKARIAGATFIVGQKGHIPDGETVDWEVGDSRRALAEIASRFYKTPSHSLRVIGVTGTSGKTTTTYLIASILKAAGHKVGIIGTVATQYPGYFEEASQTTPDASDLQKTLADMKKAQCTAVVMEVSSHALRQCRVAHVAFDVGVFTNLTPEHLDYHPDMDHYFASKEILFQEGLAYGEACGKKPVAVLNSDDPYARNVQTPYEKWVFSAQNEKFQGHLKISLAGIDGVIAGQKIHSPLTGLFNLSNVLAAATAAQAIGISPEHIAEGISQLAGVPGRLERVADPIGGRHILVDYAHKPDALEKVLQTLQEIRSPSSRIITVIGCGGDRDRTKRPVMGKCAVELSDLAWITSDNPRTEKPEAIVEEVCVGARAAQPPKTFHVSVDRRAAIRAAIREAKAGDVVLIAGKGHEDYQILGKEKIFFDDRIVASQYLAEERTSRVSIPTTENTLLQIKVISQAVTNIRSRAYICFHGGPGMDSSYFLPYLLPLANQADLVLYDHGQLPTSSDKGAKAMDLLIEEGRALLEWALWSYKEVVILGHSFGAAHSLEVLRTHFADRLEKFNALILVSPVYDSQIWDYSDSSFSDDRKAANRLIDQWKDSLKTLPEADRPNENDIFARRMTEYTPLYFSPPFHRVGRDILSRVKYSASLFRSIIDEFHPELDLKPFFASLAQTKLPVIGVSGSLDRVTTPKYVQRLFALHPKAKLHLLGGGGSDEKRGVAHYPFVEDPQSFLISLDTRF